MEAVIICRGEAGAETWSVVVCVLNIDCSPKSRETRLSKRLGDLRVRRDIQQRRNGEVVALDPETDSKVNSV